MIRTRLFVVLTALCMASGLPGAARAQTARDTTICRAAGYSVLIPFGWHSLGPQCGNHMAMDSQDGFATVTLNIDQPKTKPSLAAMRADLRKRIASLGTPNGALDFSDRTISRVVFASAVAELDSDNGLTLAFRMAETYHSHKHLTLVGFSLDQPEILNAEQYKLDVRHVIASIHFL